MSRFPSGPIPPRRVRGVRPVRLIPVVPEPGVQVPEPPTEDTQEVKFNEWAAIYGGTFPEWLVFDYLVEEVGLVVDVDFIFQSSQQGGRMISGGSVVDFEVRSHQVFIRVQGEFFHVGDPTIEGRDIMGKLAIESATGWPVVDVYENDLYEKRNYVVQQALLGRQIGHTGEA